MKSVPMLTANSITGISGLKIRPVYFLKLGGAATPTVVVKGENGKSQDALISIQWGSKLMKNVNNPLVNTKIMTSKEIIEFRRAVGSTFAATDPQAISAAQALRWVKMPMVQGLSDAEYYDDNSSIDLKRVKEIIPKLMNAKIWYDLGEVLASDIFSGNSDRFDISSGTWVNNGNLMFLDGGATSVIGLDTYDPNSGDAGNLSSKGGFDALQSLTDATKRREFAESCVGSVGSKLSKVVTSKGGGRVVIMVDGQACSIDAGSLKDFYKQKYSGDLDKGIAAGAGKLKAYLQNKSTQKEYVKKTAWQSARPGQSRVVIGRNREVAPEKSIPEGVKKRMEYLKW